MIGLVVKGLLLGAVCSACGSGEGTGTAGSPATGLGGAGVPAAGMVAIAAGAGGMTALPGSGGSGGMIVTPPMTGGAGAPMTGGMGATGAGTGGMADPMEEAGTGGTAGMEPMAGTGMGGMTGSGSCCSDGDCLCHGPDPSGLTNDDGPYNTDSYTISGVGCVHYPTDAEPPFAAVAISDGFLGSGGCSSFQTGQWGPFLASHGIVAMIVNTGSSDQPAQRGRALIRGIEAFKEENEDSGSELFGKLAGRYGTSGFSMGGGGTTYASVDDPTLLSSVAIMPWGPVRSGIMVPTLVICGASDGTASCSSHGTPAYNGIPDSVPKMRVTVSGGHNGQPSAGGGRSGEYGLAFHKVFLEGDDAGGHCWSPRSRTRRTSSSARRSRSELACARREAPARVCFTCACGADRERPPTCRRRSAARRR